MINNGNQRTAFRSVMLAGRSHVTESVVSHGTVARPCRERDVLVHCLAG